MSKIKIGCETYTWAMSGEKYKNKLEHIIEVTSKAGFKGIEPDTGFMNGFANPKVFKETLDKNNIELSVLCHVEDWRNPKETDAEKRNAELVDRVHEAFSRSHTVASTNAWTRS
ncbi:hypothetical protein ACU8V7_03670 [Zobellia nedashkovskayae]